MNAAENLLQIELEFDVRTFGGSGLCSEQVHPCRQACFARHLLQHGPQPTANTVAYYGGTERATQGVRHTRRCDGAWRIENVGAPQHSGPSAPPLGGDARKRAALSDAPDQAESLWRPLARRDFKMSRPARVLIRWRKPCFLARRRLLGWNVRFTQLSSSHPTVAVQQVESCLGAPHYTSHANGQVTRLGPRAATRQPDTHEEVCVTRDGARLLTCSALLFDLST